MSAQLQATLVGGLLTLVGGFAATVLWRWLDRRREDRKRKRELLGAVNALLHEVRYNQALLRTRIARHYPDPPLPLRDQVYTRMQLLLAEQLSEITYDIVTIPYAELQVGEIYGRVQFGSADPITTVEDEICEDVVLHFVEAQDALLEVKYDLENTGRSLRSLVRRLRPNFLRRLRTSDIVSRPDG